MEKEKNIDKESIIKRADVVFSEINTVYSSPKISKETKETLRIRLKKIQNYLIDKNNSLNSNDINIILQEISELIILVRNAQTVYNYQH